MLCPRCQQENPEGRGFCVRCAYPLPEERRQTPQYEPIVFDAPQSNAYQPAVQTATGVPQPRRHRPVVIGIVGLVMSCLSLFMAAYGFFMGSVPELIAFMTEEMRYSNVQTDINDPVFAAVLAITFAVFSLVLGILGTIFGKLAVRRYDAAPNQHMGRKMYLAAFIVGIVGIVASVALMGFGISIVR